MHRPSSLVLLLVLAAFSAPVAAAAPSCPVARRACSAAAAQHAQACRIDCGWLGDRAERTACRAACAADRAVARAACRAVDAPCAALCGAADEQACAASAQRCRTDATALERVCRTTCRARPGENGLRCRRECGQARAGAEAACGFVGATAVAGPATLPDLPSGHPADLALLTAAERALIEASDARARAIRMRPLRVVVGRPGATVTVTQTRHGFPFGIAVDLRRFASADDLAFFESITMPHASVAVLENTAKWRNVEPADGVYDYAAMDADVAWARARRFLVKGHPLLWGNGPPLGSSGVPQWLVDRFPQASLTPSERETLRGYLRRHVETTVGRQRGRIGIWDATNETLNVTTPWFIDRLGHGITDDVFRWAHAADPGATLVFNEWIVEVFTGLPTPTAAEVRDRVRALLAAGVPVHAIGQQSHYAPTLAYVGVPVDLSGRTRIDDYAMALDTLAETGLPIHMTETNFVQPDDPEARAAQAEGIMRLWWGHPSVEQIVIWGIWNKVAGRDEFDVGLWDDDRRITRHGEAMLSLMNDRWRTRATLVADALGAVELDATLGEYVVEWDAASGPAHAGFTLERGPGRAVVAVGGSPRTP